MAKIKTNRPEAMVYNGQEMPFLRRATTADGSAFGFDKNSDALDLSHVNLAKYVEAAEQTLELAVATRPEAPTVQKRRISLMNNGGFVTHVVMNGDGVLLKNKQPDPDFPAPGPYSHIDQGAHERLGLDALLAAEAATAVELSNGPLMVMPSIAPCPLNTLVMASCKALTSCSA